MIDAHTIECDKEREQMVIHHMEHFLDSGTAGVVKDEEELFAKWLWAFHEEHADMSRDQFDKNFRRLKPEFTDVWRQVLRGSRLGEGEQEGETPGGAGNESGGEVVASFAGFA